VQQPVPGEQGDGEVRGEVGGTSDIGRPRRGLGVSKSLIGGPKRGLRAPKSLIGRPKSGLQASKSLIGRLKRHIGRPARSVDLIVDLDGNGNVDLDVRP
jgi:hypothetical protein